MVTQKEIAAACGLSKAAVSRALNDFPDISESTKQLVRETAEKMGYRKSVLAKKKKHTYRIGLVVTEDAETFFHHAIIMEIRSDLLERGYDLVLLCPAEQKETMDRSDAAESTGRGSFDQEDMGEDIFAAVHQSRAVAERPGYISRARILELEGIFVISSIPEGQLFQRKSYGKLRELITGEMPVISVDCRFGGCGCVLPDYKDGFRTMLRYIKGLGHWRIAVVYGGDEKGEDPIEGMIRLVCHDSGMQIPKRFIRKVKRESAQDAYEATLALLQDTKWIRPTCILYGDSFLLEGGCAAIRSQGLQIPSDISVVSMLYTDHYRLWDCPLTCWQTPSSRIAGEAVRMMLMEIYEPGKTQRQTNLVKGNMQIGDSLRAIL